MFRVYEGYLCVFRHAVQKENGVNRVKYFRKNSFSDNKKIGQTKKKVGEKRLTRLTPNEGDAYNPADHSGRLRQKMPEGSGEAILPTV